MQVHIARSRQHTVWGAYVAGAHCRQQAAHGVWGVCRRCTLQAAGSTRGEGRMLREVQAVRYPEQLKGDGGSVGL